MLDMAKHFVYDLIVSFHYLAPLVSQVWSKLVINYAYDHFINIIMFFSVSVFFFVILNFDILIELEKKNQACGFIFLNLKKKAAKNGELRFMILNRVLLTDEIASAALF